MQSVDTSPSHGRAEPPAAQHRERRRRVSAAGVIGEVLLTAGAIALLYIVWQLWIGDLIYGAQASTEGQNLSDQWQHQYEETVAPSAEPSGTSDPFVEPPLLSRPADAESFALMRVPRFGSDWIYDIAGGTTPERTLDTVRVGHYTDVAAMPGQVGNFALAGHRTTFGGPFRGLAELRLGDAIIVEVPDGWYTYRFRTLEYVTPREVDVLLDVPQAPDVPAGERYLTMTSCSPIGSLAERIVAYGVFEGYTQRSAGPPAALTAPIS